MIRIDIQDFASTMTPLQHLGDAEMMGKPWPTGTVPDAVLQEAGIRMFGCYGTGRLNSAILYECRGAFDEKDRPVGHVFAADGQSAYRVPSFKRLCDFDAASNAEGDNFVVFSMTDEAFKKYGGDMQVKSLPVTSSITARAG